MSHKILLHRVPCTNVLAWHNGKHNQYIVNVELLQRQEPIFSWKLDFEICVSSELAEH